MSNFYNPHRKVSYNYGGENWKLSRSKIDLFLQCPRCFYLDNKLGTKRPPGFPFNLNSTVDLLLKKEFDQHRAKNKQHPLQKKYKIDAKPVAHDELDVWRENFQGVRYFHKSTGILVSGAIDDLWIDSKGKYIVVDYKATSKEEPIIKLDQDWHIGYKRQIEVYQWLLRKNGLNVSNTSYFVYCNGRKDREAFDARLEFDVVLIPYKGSDTWVEPTINDIHKCLDSKKIPKADPDCDYCNYRRAVKKIEKK